MDVDGSDGDASRRPEPNELPSCSSDSLEGEQFDPNSAPPGHVDQKQATRRPIFPRLNLQSQCNSPRPSQPADLFRKPFQRVQVQAQQTPPFFNLLNTVSIKRGDHVNNNRPRQSEASPAQNAFHQVSPSGAPLNLLAHSKGAYMNPRTPRPLQAPGSLKHIVKEDASSREWEHSATPSLPGADLDLDELAVKALKENKTLKIELGQAQSHLQNMTRNIENLKEENARLSAKIIESDKHICSLKAELSSICNELTSVRSESLSIKAALDSNQRDLTLTNSELMASRSQNLTLMSTNQELERHQNSSRLKLDATKKALISFKNDYAGLMSSFNDLKRTHDTATVVVANLSAEVAECRKTASDAMRKIETSQNTNTTSIMGSARVRDAFDELRETLAESYRTNDLLRDKLHLHLGQIVDLNDRIKELEGEKRDFLKLLVVQEEQQAKREELGTRMEDLVDRLAKREQEVEIATADAVTLKAKLQVAETSISNLQGKVADDAAKLELLSNVREELDRAKIGNQMLDKLLAEKSGRITTLEQNVLITTNQLTECQKLSSKLENELVSMRSSAKEHEKEKTTLQVQIQQLQERLSDSRNTLIQAEANAEMIKVRAEKEREEALQSLEASIAGLKRTLAAKTVEHNTNEVSLKKARHEIAEKENLLKQKSSQLNALEERFEAQAATLRLEKEQCGDLQERLQTSERSLADTTSQLRMEIVALQHQVETYRSAASELKTARELLAGKDFALTRSIGDLTDLQGRFDAQMKDLRANSETLIRDRALLSAEREKCESLISDIVKLKLCLAEKERLLMDAENQASVLQERLDAQKVALQMMKEQLEALQERVIGAESKHAGQLESIREKLKAEIATVQEQRAGLQVCLNQARQDAVDQRTLLDDRLSRQEKASERLLEAQQRRAESAEDAAVQAKLSLNMTKKELDDCLCRQKDSGVQLELMERELRDTQSKLQDALAQVQSVQEERDERDKGRLTLLDKINAVEIQMSSLMEINQSLTNRSKTLQERYENGDLSDQERSFVHFIVSTTQSIHENDLLEKMNELRRRDAVNNTLQERVKMLESSIARMLRERGADIRPEVKSLVNLSLWMSSSPQDGLNSVDVQIPTVEPLHLNARTSAPITPRDDTSFAGRETAETSKVDYAHDGDDDNIQQAPMFSKLSEPDSEDDVPLSELTRISPSPSRFVQGASKRERAQSPVAATMGRPARRLRRSGPASGTNQVAKLPKAPKKVSILPDSRNIHSRLQDRKGKNKTMFTVVGQFAIELCFEQSSMAQPIVFR